MRSRITLSVSVLALAVSAAVAGVADAAPQADVRASSPALAQAPAPSSVAAPVRYAAGRYIVTFADEPAASYTGYRSGFPATQPKRGQHLATRSTAVVKWQRYLRSKHDRALAKVGAEKYYDFTIANNAVAARLTGRQATQLSKMAGVVALSPDRKARPDTTFSPEFLGLSDTGGLWDQLAGPDSRAGAGIVVGVLDTGIWPESTAFKGNTGIPVPGDWKGKCVPGELWSKKHCNDKLIGARYYTAGFGITQIAKYDYISPRDFDGHGTHTSSTAAGNHGTNVTIDGNAIGTGSGMAPGAKVAMYKVCWEGRPGVDPGCFNSDSVAAINDAVADGVDVINYSIGGSSESSVLDPVEQAFRAASNAGVYVANSAGNSGPGASTFDHPSPWVTTTAAATFRRAFQAVELGNGARYVGASVTPSLTTPTQLVTSLSVKLASATDANAMLCAPGTLDPAKAAGKVVQCDRGVVDRIAKSFEVQRAGGVGMVMTNVSLNSLNGDYHPIPSVHVDHVARPAILAYIADAGAGATAKIVPLTAAELASAPEVPEIAAFSSRGPSVTTDGDILKPDIAAPGVDVVAAVAPPGHFGRNWDFISGTSMASPHMAGIGALIKSLHPNWLPSEIKSALMTTARATVSSFDDPFAQGAGFVQPNPAGDPGLVYPTTANEYRSFMVSLGVQFAPPFNTLEPIEASDLNQASIAVGQLAGVETVTRRVKNVSDATSTYVAIAEMPGITVSVNPPSLVLQPGEEATYEVTFTNTPAATLDEWAIGSLTWSDGAGHAVRSPIAVRPVSLSAPTEVHGEGVEGSLSYDVQFGYAGPFLAQPNGLVGVTPLVDSVATGSFDADNPVADADTKKYTVSVPAGTLAARFSLDAGDDTADLDVWVYDEDGDLVGLSASGAADEEVTLVSPADGDYDVYVNGFATPGGSTSYQLANFVVPPGSAGNFTVTAPASATLGDQGAVDLAWTGLDPTKRYLGAVTYHNTLSDIGMTLFSVN